MVLGLAAALTITGCSDDTGGPTAASSGTDATRSAVTSGTGGGGTRTAAPSTGRAAPPSYSSDAGPFTTQVAQRLGRDTVPAGQMQRATTGTWKGTPVGVLVEGGDVTLAVGAGDTWRIVGGWWPSKNLPGPYLGGKSHVLLLGSDARPNQKVDRSRADAIQIVGLDGHGGGGIVGIPRDTRAALSTGGTGKVNAAMPRGGPDAQVATVRRLTGLPISGYLVTGFDGFRAGVDAIGGVEVTLTRPVRYLKAGTQRLNGKDLLWVARERKSLPMGDLDRSANQGMILMQVLTQVRSRGVTSLPALMSATGKHVITDLTPAQVLTLFAAGYALNPSRVGRQVAPAVPDGADVRLTSAAAPVFRKFADGNL